MKFIHVLVIVIISAAVAWSVAHFTPSVGTAPAARETAYQRVMRTGTIRCGYALFPQIVERDVSTKQMSGMYVDMMDQIGKHLKLKVEWAEEAGFGDILSGLAAGRFDVVCAPLTHTPGRARMTEFTTPVLFAPYYLYARSDDKRFDNHYERVNDPSVKVAVLEGEMSQTVKEESFPKAGIVSLPNLTDSSQVLLQVTMGKADVAMAEPSIVEPFIIHNPGKLRRVEGASLRMEKGGLSVAVGEGDLRKLLDTTIEYLYDNGIMQSVIEKHVTAPDHFLYPAQPWGAAVQPK